jgi:hypothetical protein
LKDGTGECECGSALCLGERKDYEIGLEAAHLGDEKAKRTKNYIISFGISNSYGSTQLAHPLISITTYCYWTNGIRSTFIVAVLELFTKLATRAGITE